MPWEFGVVILLIIPFFIVGFWKRKAAWAFASSVLLVFLALFGAGVIKTFQALAIYGKNDPQLLAGGISASFVGTILRMLIYLPLLWIFQWWILRRHRRKNRKVDADKTLS